LIASGVFISGGVLLLIAVVLIIVWIVR